MEYAIKHKTLYESFFRQKNIFLDISMMLIAVVFLGILSNLYIPLWPVPITGQTLGIFLIAFWFGSRKGLVTLGLYTLAGIIGFSVFTQHKSGIAAITGPTGGYILGFLAAVFVVGYLIEKGYGRTKTSVLYCMILGNAIILNCNKRNVYYTFSFTMKLPSNWILYICCSMCCCCFSNNSTRKNDKNCLSTLNK